MRMEKVMVPLGLLAVGEKAEVAEVKIKEAATHCCSCRKGKGGCRARLEAMGLRTGKTVEILHNPGRSAMLVKVDDSRIVLGRGAAMKIMVRRKDG